MKKFLALFLTFLIFFSFFYINPSRGETPQTIGFGLVQSEFLGPKGVSLDAEGNIYVLDAGNYRVQVFDSKGNFKFMFGGKGTEPYQFMSPAGITVSRGKVYITDGYGDITASNKIVVYDTSGNFLFFFGTRGAEEGNLSAPTGIGADEQGNIYVCDIGNKRIEKYNENGKFITTLGEGIIDSPMGIYVKNEKIYITDWTKSKVYILSSRGEKLREFTYEDMNLPVGIALDDSDNIYVVDSGFSACIYKFNNDGKFIKQIGSYGVGQSEFLGPYDIAISKNVMIVSDENGSRIEALTTDGNFIWEIKSPFYRKESVNLPSDMAIKNDNIYIADSLNWRIAVLNKQGLFVKEIKSIFGMPEWMTKAKKLFDKIDMPFIKYPVFIKILNNGNLLIGDYGKSEVSSDEYGNLILMPFFRFLIISPDGNFIKSFGDPNKTPLVEAMDIDETKNEVFAGFRTDVYVYDLDANYLKRIDLTYFNFGYIQDIVLTEQSFYACFYPSGKVAEFSRGGQLIRTISSYGNAPGKTSYPHNVTLDDSGNIYVADSGNARIQIFDKNANLKEYFGVRGTRIGELIHPIKISLTDNQIFVLDDYTGKITVFDRSSKKAVNTLCETGIKEGKLIFPVAVAATSKGEVMVLDGYLGLIHKFDQDGTPLFKFGTELDIRQRFSTSPTFNFNGKISIDENDNIYVTAPYNDFIYIFDEYGNMVNGIPCDIYGMQTPFGIYVGKDRIYVTDATLGTIFVFDKNFTRLLLKFGTVGTEMEQLNAPWGITSDNEGNIYIADSGNLNVKIFDSKGKLTKAIPIEVDYSEPPFTPTDIFFYNNYLYVLDSYGHQIIFMNKQGETVQTFGRKGGPGSNYAGLKGNEFYGTEYGKFLYPLGIFVRDNKIYIADTSNFRIDVIPLNTFFDVNAPQISAKNIPPKYTNNNTFDITFQVSDDKTPSDQIEIFTDINGNGYNKVSGSVLQLRNLTEGPYRIFAKAIDSSGNESTLLKIEFVIDLTPSKITLNMPSSTQNSTTKISGTVTDSLSGVKELEINQKSVAINNNGAFSTNISLIPGTNEILAQAFDLAGNTILKSGTIFRSVTIVMRIGQNKFAVNGTEKTLDAPPLIKDGRTLVAIRPVIEELGGTINWERESKKVTISLKSNKIELWIGKDLAVVNGITKYIDPINQNVVPQIINGRTMLPVRFVAQNLGCTVDWDGSTQTITIKNQ